MITYLIDSGACAFRDVYTVWPNSVRVRKYATGATDCLAPPFVRLSVPTISTHSDKFNHIWVKADDHMYPPCKAAVRSDDFMVQSKNFSIYMFCHITPIIKLIAIVIIVILYKITYLHLIRF